jgi:hypothetical protein
VGFPLGLGLPLGLGFALGLGLRFGGVFSPSFLLLLGGAFPGGGGALVGGAGGLPGGGGAFAGGIGVLAGGAFLGLCGGLGGGGGTLSAMTILYWQPEVLFERIGDMMSFSLSKRDMIKVIRKVLEVIFLLHPSPQVLSQINYLLLLLLAVDIILHMHQQSRLLQVDRQ